MTDEHHGTPKSTEWYIVAGILLSCIVGYALFINSPMMAITFILIGVTVYLTVGKEPKETRFAITQEGIIAGRDIYDYEVLRSFWIFYEPNARKVISIRTDTDLTPYVHIPLGDANPVHVRALLLQHLPEKKHPVRLVDILEMFF